MNILSIIGISIAALAIGYNGFDWRTFPLGLAIAILLVAILLQMGLNFTPPTWINRTAIVLVLGSVVLTTIALITFPNIAIPKPSGAHTVGTTLLTANNTKLRLWYPAIPSNSAKRYRYLSGVTHSSTFVPAFIYGHLKGRITEAFVDTPLSPTEAPYPVIFYMHGADSFSEDNTFRQMELASHGYVVVAVHPQKPFTDYQIDPNLAYEPATFAATLARDIVPDQVRDMETAAKAIFEPSADQNSIIDAKQLQDGFGVLGYSLGGGVATQFCNDHPNCRAIINLDGNAFGPVGKTGVAVPYLHLSQNTLFPGPTEKTLPEIMQRSADHYAAEVSEIVRLTANKAPAYWYTLRGSGHASFTDLALWTPARFAMLGTLLGNGEANAMRRVIDDLTISFFDQFLGEKTGFEAASARHANHLFLMEPNLEGSIDNAQ